MDLGRLVRGEKVKKTLVKITETSLKDGGQTECVMEQAFFEAGSSSDAEVRALQLNLSVQPLSVGFPSVSRTYQNTG